MKDYATYLRLPYLIAFFLIGALYTVLFLKHPIGGLITLFFSLIYGWGVFLVFSYFTSLVWKKIFEGAIQDPNIVNTLLPANILFVLLLYMGIATSLNDYMDPRGERSILWLSIIAVPFFTSLIGGISSGSLVLLRGWDSRKIIIFGNIVAIIFVILFFTYNLGLKI